MERERREGKKKKLPANLVIPLNSGIFGYINYLVDKDRRQILETLTNGEFYCPRNQSLSHGV